MIIVNIDEESSLKSSNVAVTLPCRASCSGRESLVNPPPYSTRTGRAESADYGAISNLHKLQQKSISRFGRKRPWVLVLFLALAVMTLVVSTFAFALVIGSTRAPHMPFPVRLSLIQHFFSVFELKFRAGLQTTKIKVAHHFLHLPRIEECQ